jgi:hypothetical protein
MQPQQGRHWIGSAPTGEAMGQTDGAKMFSEKYILYKNLTLTDITDASPLYSLKFRQVQVQI